MATAKEAQTLVSYFVAKAKERYGVQPVVNRYSARWGFDSMLIDLTPTEVKALIDYYFETVSQNGHTLEWFFYNHDKLIVARQSTLKDKEALALAREETKRRVEEWRKKNGKY